mmetsp:Transcript_39472/g.63262  ORF Transcript_39472/g.63262 Transcript_39472/m.63262 type:complete len:430 (-) Transcript_39472:154-1443(-)
MRTSKEAFCLIYFWFSLSILLFVCIMESNIPTMDSISVEEKANKLKLQKWPPLQEILQYEVTLKLFIEHIFSEWSAENYFFWRDAVVFEATYQGATSNEYRNMISDFKLMYHKYIKADSLHVVNISWQTRERFKRCVNMAENEELEYSDKSLCSFDKKKHHKNLGKKRQEEYVDEVQMSEIKLHDTVMNEKLGGSSNKAVYGNSSADGDKDVVIGRSSQAQSSRKHITRGGGPSSGSMRSSRAAGDIRPGSQSEAKLETKSEVSGRFQLRSTPPTPKRENYRGRRRHTLHQFLTKSRRTRYHTDDDSSGSSDSCSPMRQITQDKKIMDKGELKSIVKALKYLRENEGRYIEHERSLPQPLKNISKCVKCAEKEVYKLMSRDTYRRFKIIPEVSKVVMRCIVLGFIGEKNEVSESMSSRRSPKPLTAITR